VLTQCHGGNQAVSNDLREVIVAAHQSGKGYTIIYKLFRVHHSTVRNDYSKVKNIQDRYQSFQEWMSQEGHPKVRLCNAQRYYKKTQGALQASVSTLNVKVHDSTIRIGQHSLGL